MAIAKDPAWRAWCDQRRHRPSNALAPKAGLVAVATKLLRVAWVCVRHGTVYDGGRVFPASADVAI